MATVTREEIVDSIVTRELIGSSRTGSSPTGISPTGSSPTGSSPTGISPTGISEPLCDSPYKKQVEVQIATDTYPTDTSWTITDSNSVVVMEGKAYSKQSELYTTTKFLNVGSYMFEIIDTYSDGL